MTKKIQNTTGRIGIRFALEDAPMIYALHAEDVGALVQALILYVFEGEEPDLGYPLDAIFEVLRKHQD